MTNPTFASPAPTRPVGIGGILRKAGERPIRSAGVPKVPRPGSERRDSPMRSSERDVIEFQQEADVMVDSAGRKQSVALTVDIFRDSPLATCASDADGIVTLWNPACERLFGWSAAETVGRFSPVVREADLDSCRELRERVMQGEMVVQTEARRRGKDGREIDVSFTAVPMRDDEDRIVGVLEFTTDISDRQEAEQAQPESDDYYHALVEWSSDIITVLEADGSWRFSGDAGRRLLGWPAGYRPEGGVFALLHPDDVDLASRAFEEVLSGQRGPDQPVEFRICSTDGSPHWFETVGRNLLDDPAVRGVVLNSRHTCDRHRLEEELKARLAFEDVVGGIAERFASAADGEEDTCIDWALARIGEFVSADHCYLFRFSDDGAVMINSHEWCADGIEPQLEQLQDLPVDVFPWWNARLRDRSFVDVPRIADLPAEATAEREILGVLDIRSVLAVPIASAGRLRGFVGFNAVRAERDWPDDAVGILRSAGAAFLTAIERKEAGEHLTHLAYHDSLTGLPNRPLFLELLTHALERTRRSSSPFAVLFLDLDWFKVVNDTLGHEVGDELLFAVGKRLRSAVRPGATVARFGGDEFIILCEDLSRDRTHQEASVVADRLLDTLRTPFEVDGDEVLVGASIGIIISDKAHDQVQLILRDADAAMYRAKARGRGRWVFFD